MAKAKRKETKKLDAILLFGEEKPREKQADKVCIVQKWISAQKARIQAAQRAKIGPSSDEFASFWQT